MVPVLMLSRLGSAPANSGATAVASDDPPIQVWLNQDNHFRRGDNARVHVKLADDGYLVVLRADAAGRVRVLFPLDPSDDAFVRGGRKFEVRARGDREAFSIDERDGSGVVLAARSAAPFKFDEFVRGDHWDYRVLDARQTGDDQEAALLDMVQRMVPDGHFDYDVQKYFVESHRAYRGDYYPSYGLGLSFGWGWPYSRFGFSYGYAGSCFDPFFYDPFFCGAAYYSPFFYGYSPFFSGYSPFFSGYSPFVYGYRYRPFVYTGGLVFYNQPRIRSRFDFQTLPRTSATTGVGPRLRVPQGTLLSRQGPSAVQVRVRDAVLRDGAERVQSFPRRQGVRRPVERSDN